MTSRVGILVLLFLITFQSHAESFRALVDGIHTVSLTQPEGITVPLSYISSSLIVIEGDTRFFRGIQLELTSPRTFLNHRGYLAAVLYGSLNRVPGVGVADLVGRRLAFDPIPARIQTVYEIPIREGHGLRTSPFATVLTDVVDPSSFPLLFRLMPVMQGIPGAVERMVFNLNVRPILSNEGAVRINFRYPDNLRGRPFTVLLNGEIIENPGNERVLREGEHSLVVLSEDYRNHSSRFIVERAKVLDLMIELQDPTPLLIFEGPENARVYLNNVFIPNPRVFRPVEPGFYEVRFQVGDFTVIRSLTIQRGRTYRVAMSLDLDITESE